MNNFDRPFTFDRVVRIVITLAIIIGLFLFIKTISGALLPFLIAWLIAYLINPLVEFFQYRLKIRSRIISIIIAIVTILASLGGIIAMIAPSISDETGKFIDLIGQYDTNNAHIPFVPQSWVDFITQNIDYNAFIKYLNKDDIVAILNQVVPGFVKIFSGSLNIIFGIVASSIVFLYIIFILLDYEKISEGFLYLIPPKYRGSVSAVADDVKVSMNRYFRGQALVALCVGILFSIGFKIIGLPMAIVLGLFIGLLNMVPYLQIVGFIPTIILCILKAAEGGGNFWLILAGATSVFVVVQTIQDTIIVPKIMGKVTGLNPAVILLSLSIWGSLLGILGMIIALPMTTLFLSYYQRFIINNENIYKEIDKKEDNSD